ncbi:MEDS domain-containing protein [Prauserella cavernicola]|uniref:MEDS domain-containing protein n=1 Tax=Prauserella cavernicola TaxID=2800127 RepID=A0A934V1U6_9PSEU|nr:MEDS domain-containing protein [Prauserella cavernicola]MBK1783926.1 MEDS domain-containing protein [Prauserella cavernicola]
MTTGPDDAGLRHQAALFASDAEFLELVLPFLRDGHEAGEPTVVALDEERTGLVEAALGTGLDVTFLESATRYSGPAHTVDAYRKMFASYLEEDTERVRLVGGIPLSPWTRTGPGGRTTKRQLRVPGPGGVPGQARGRRGRPRNTHARRRTGRSAAEGRPPRGAEPRRDHPAPGGPGRGFRLRGERDGHERDRPRPLARSRLWAAPERLVATVSDRGHGPGDPVVGLLPVADSPSGGVGLWLVHQICDHVTLGRDDDGFTVRMIVGTRVTRWGSSS